MNLLYVSLTGADNDVDIRYLEQFSESYPFYECAILMFPEREGLARNPTVDWRHTFYQSKVKNRALHLCGSAINKLAHRDSDLLKELENFQRVQINLKTQWATDELVGQLVEVVESLPHIQFITQHNPLNAPYFKFWDSVKNHGYLYDASLGKGLAPDLWLPPIQGKPTGYAGGLGPDNIGDNLLKIGSVAGAVPVWIDMETGLRTDDKFDLVKAQRVLDTVNNFIVD